MIWTTVTQPNFVYMPVLYMALKFLDIATKDHKKRYKMIS